MTKDEAMKLALEALKDMNCGWGYIRESHGDLYGVGWDRAQEKADDAIKALRQALEQPEQTVSLEEYKRLQRLVTSQGIRLMEYESKQEPVAWMYVNKDGECEQIEFGDPFNDPSVTLLYTAPPKREWQGLTDEEIVKASIGNVEGEHMLPHSFARAIEKLLREKNHD